MFELLNSWDSVPVCSLIRGVSGVSRHIGTGGNGVAADNNWSVGELVIAHAAVGCVNGQLSSGNCGKGALNATVALAAQPLIIKFPSFGTWGAIPEAAEAGLIGGEAARIGGGRFEDGFSVAAIQYLSAFTPSNDVGSPVRQLGQDIEGFAVDAYAAVVGQIGAIYAFFEDIGQIAVDFINGKFSALGMDFARTAYDLLLPHYGFYGGSGWGTRQFLPPGATVPSVEPLNQQDWANFVHDTNGDDTLWVQNSYATNSNFLPTGPLGILYKMVGTVPFTIAGKLQ